MNQKKTHQEVILDLAQIEQGLNCLQKIEGSIRYKATLVVSGTRNAEQDINDKESKPFAFTMNLDSTTQDLINFFTAYKSTLQTNKEFLIKELEQLHSTT